MALKATVYKAELQVSDLDRQVYAQHALTLAQHPSETDERLMVRLVAFAMFADERLAFGRGLSTDNEPDLWLRSRSDDIELWIELGQPDESRIRKACGRSREVIVIGYSGRSFGLWWERNAAALARCGNLGVLELPAGTGAALAPMLRRNLQLQCLIQDGELQLISEQEMLNIAPIWHQRPAA